MTRTDSCWPETCHVLSPDTIRHDSTREGRALLKFQARSSNPPYDMLSLPQADVESFTPDCGALSTSRANRLVSSMWLLVGLVWYRGGRSISVFLHVKGMKSSVYVCEGVTVLLEVAP